MTTDASEKGLETLIMRHMTGEDGFAVTPNMVAERPPPYSGTGYTAGSARDYDRAHALDVPQLFAFLRATQPEAIKKLALADAGDAKDINRLKFLARLSAEIGKRGVVDVLRKGVGHGPVHFDLFYGTPSAGNAKAEALHLQNRFSVTRQFGTLFTDTDRVARRIRDDIAPQVAADAAYQNAKEKTPHTARMAHDQALGKVMQILLRDDTQVYKQFVENESFKRFVGDMVYALTSP